MAMPHRGQEAAPQGARGPRRGAGMVAQGRTRGGGGGEAGAHAGKGKGREREREEGELTLGSKNRR
jgi:hypothetical protein